MNACELEAFAAKEWAAMSQEDRQEYDNDFDFFVYDLYFACCT